MDEIAEAASNAALAAIQPATRFPEIRDRTQLAVDRASGIPPLVQGVRRRLRAVLVLEPRIHVPDQMVIVVVADHQFFELAVFAQLAPDVFVECVKVVLQLVLVHFVLGVEGWVLVEVREQYRLRVGRLDVLSRAAVAMAARADFIVEAAVDFVLLGAEDGS